METSSSAMKQLRTEFQLDDFAYSFVYEYLRLDDEKRNAVQEFFYNVLNGMGSVGCAEPEAAVPSVQRSAVEQTEAEYIKRMSGLARKGKSAASNMTSGTGSKVINQ